MAEKEYRARCKCGFVTNAYGSQEAADSALATHKLHCRK